MKKIALLLLLIPFLKGSAQNIDSLLAIPQFVELEVSTPQPRLKEKFKISLDIAYARANIFRSTIGKLRMAPGGEMNDSKMVMKVNAMKKGENEIGPLQFTVNGTVYTSNKIKYTVIDPLPETDQGLWIRKVQTGDSTFCLIIEQRIPAVSRVTQVSAKESSYSNLPVSDKNFKFKNSYSIDGIEGSSSSSNSEQGYFINENGTPKPYQFYYSITHFRIVDKAKKIVITEDKFENLPAGYKFESIVVQ